MSTPRNNSRAAYSAEGSRDNAGSGESGILTVTAKSLTQPIKGRESVRNGFPDGVINSSISKNQSIPISSIYCQAVSFNSVQFNPIQFPIQSTSIQSNSIQFNSIQFNSTQFNSIQLNPTQFNSIQSNPILFSS